MSGDTAITVVVMIVVGLAAPFLNRFLQRTRVDVMCRQDTFDYTGSGGAFRAIRVTVTNGSPSNKIYLTAVGLQRLRLLPIPGFRTFTFATSHNFKSVLDPGELDEVYFRMDEARPFATEAGWHRGPRLVRAMVGLTTKSPRRSPLIIARLN